MFLNNKRNIILGFVLLFLWGTSARALAQDTDSTDDVQSPVKRSLVNTSESEISISGKLVDAVTGKPINAAELEIKDYASAITNEDGSFTIRAPYGTDILKVKAWGYQTKEIAIKGRSFIEIGLISETFPSFYAKGEDARGLNSPFSNSHMKTFFPTAVTSLEERMQFELGEIRTITRSGFSGIGANMFVRGYNSINGNSQPLIVVDGVPYETLLDKNSILKGHTNNALTNIDIEDIEDVSLIKDGYALYGMKGANGVIQIRTKRATEVPSKIAFTSSWGVNLSPKKIPVLNATDYRAYASEQMISAGFTAQQIQDQVYLNDDRSKPTFYTYHNDTDWQDEVYRNGLIQNYHIHITGGDEIAKYAISLGYMDVENTIKEASFNRFNTRFNADIDLTKDLVLSLGVSYSQTNTYDRDQGIVQRSSPTYIALIKSPLVAPTLISNTGYVSPTLAGVDFWGVSNPMAIQRNGVGDNNQYRLGLNGKIDYKLTSDIKLNGVFGYDFDKVRETFFVPSEGVSTELLERTGAISRNFVGSRINQFQGVFTGLSSEYKKTFDYIHQLDANIGLRYQSNKYEATGGTGHNTPNDQVNLSNSLDERIFTTYMDEWKWASVYLNANYTLRNKYFFSASISRDGSSRASENERYGIFPSLGGMWRASSEGFMSDVKFLDLLQLRASVGVVGSDDFAGVSPVELFGSVPYQNFMGLTLQNLSNKNLKWETTTKLNGGADFALFNERLSFSADLYKNKTKDLITLRDATSISGFESIFTNSGELENNGVELAMNLRVVDTRDFKVNTRVSFAKYKNKVTSLPDGKDIISSFSGATILTRVGQPIGLFYGYKTKGVFSTAQEAADANLKTYYNNTDLYAFEAGDIHFEDIAGADGSAPDGVIDENDRQIIGDPNPDFYGSFALNFTYKAFGLNFVFTGAYGNDVYNHLRANIESMSSFNNQSTAVLNRWRGEGQVTSIPRATYNDVRGNSRFSDRWIEDGSYLRLKNVTFTWTSPKKVLNFVDGLTVFATANNLFLITKYLGSDPEFSTSNSPLFQGIDTGLLSQGRSFTAGVKINL